MSFTASDRHRRMADHCADIILDHFQTFQNRFATVTREAALHFAGRNWPGLQQIARQRLDLYRDAIDRLEVAVRPALAPHPQEKSIWRRMKSIYIDRIRHREDRELAETFFNSTTRRILATVGVDETVEIVAPARENSGHPAGPISHVFLPDGSLADSLAQILNSYRLGAPYRDVAGDARRLADRIGAGLTSAGGGSHVGRIELLKSVFYRGRQAYLIGRMRGGPLSLPLVIALTHPPAGITIDAVLLDAASVSILFSFTRAHFLVDSGHPARLIRFLKTIMPLKPVAELYTSIGYVKHGKTELYRSLVEHTRECSGETFDISRGQPGLVMIAFDMPGHDVVFKLIRDRFRKPKTTTRHEVMAKYDLVFRHDRAGRLPEAHSFEHLKFELCWFSQPLLDELKREASRTVAVGGQDVVIRHAFVERRVTPLDVYLKEVDLHKARLAVIDYGQAIKDLAFSNIFAGDMLLKNFGVTRHGRVVFYDYDELALITDCRFRKLPAAMHVEDELAAEPWFHVDDSDVFPEEFIGFLGLPEDLKQILIRRHGDLFTVQFWQEAQQRIRSGALSDISPYAPRHRLP